MKKILLSSLLILLASQVNAANIAVSKIINNSGRPVTFGRPFPDGKRFCMFIPGSQVTTNLDNKGRYQFPWIGSKSDLESSDNKTKVFIVGTKQGVFRLTQVNKLIGKGLYKFEPHETTPIRISESISKGSGKIIVDIEGEVSFEKD